MESLESPNKLAIDWLASFIHHYPATAEEVIDVALEYEFDNTMVRFLELFYPNERFYSHPDFVSRCYFLANIIEEEKDTEKEFLIGSQE